MGSKMTTSSVKPLTPQVVTPSSEKISINESSPSIECFGLNIGQVYNYCSKGITYKVKIKNVFFERKHPTVVGTFPSGEGLFYFSLVRPIENPHGPLLCRELLDENGNHLCFPFTSSTRPTDNFWEDVPTMDKWKLHVEERRHLHNIEWSKQKHKHNMEAMRFKYGSERAVEPASCMERFINNKILYQNKSDI